MRKAIELMRSWRASFKQTAEALSNVTSASKGQLCTAPLGGGFFPFKSSNHSKFPCLKCNPLVCQIILLIILCLAFTCCFYLLEHFAKEVFCIIVSIYTFLFPPDHFFFFRSFVDGLQIGVAASYHYLPQSLLQPSSLITQGKQPSAYSTSHSPICLHWWGIRCVRSSCGTGSFQQNCSVQSVFWRDFILLSPKLLTPACHCNLSFLCGCYISLKPHFTVSDTVCNTCGRSIFKTSQKWDHNEKANGHWWACTEFFN